jgi:hypothetical protein
MSKEVLMSVAVMLTAPAVLSQIAGNYGRPDPNDPDDSKWSTAEVVTLIVVVLVLAGMGWAGRHLGLY